MSAEWDTRVAEGRAGALIHTLEAEINRLRDKVNALEIELLIADEAHAAVTGERDRAIDRCVARVARDGTPGPIRLGGMAHE